MRPTDKIRRQLLTYGTDEYRKEREEFFLSNLTFGSFRCFIAGLRKIGLALFAQNES